MEQCALEQQRALAVMNAIKKVRRHIEGDPQSEAARVLANLTACLADERDFPLADLYRLDLESFDLALELMRDWRLDRYYAARLRLLDLILVDVMPQVADGDAPAAGGATRRAPTEGPA